MGSLPTWSSFMGNSMALEFDVGNSSAFKFFYGQLNGPRVQCSPSSCLHHYILFSVSFIGFIYIQLVV